MLCMAKEYKYSIGNVQDILLKKDTLKKIKNTILKSESMLWIRYGCFVIMDVSLT